MASITLKVDNQKAVIEGLKSQIPVALEAIGMQCETYAKGECVVDTGLLRNSITHAVGGKEPAQQTYQSNSVSRKTGKAIKVKSGSYHGKAPDEQAVFIGTNVEYAPYIEYGLAKGDAQPFLKPAVMNHKDEYMRLAKEVLQQVQI